MITKKEKEELIKKAVEVSKNAYHPVTSSGTGAAVLTEKGNIYCGCNVQSVISGLGTCAERCAIDNAVSHGEYKFKAIAVYFPSEKITKPSKITEIKVEKFPRLKTKIGEFDRVVGGGIVYGSLGLLAGHPGIGKSTLLLTIAGKIAEEGVKVLYVSAEDGI